MQHFAIADLDLAAEPGRQVLADLRDRHGEILAAAATLPRRLFVIRSAWAPGLAFVGGEAEAPGHAGRFSLAGSGETLVDALASCLGEGVERVSQIERPDDVVTPVAGDVCLASAQSLMDSIIASKSGTGGAMPAWCQGTTLATGAPVLVAADWCLRRGPNAAFAIPDSALSTGAAAGPDRATAAARGLLELIERDAAALWWLGGKRGRPLAVDGAAMAEAVRLFRVLRHGDDTRQSWLLDITTDLDIPVIAAISVDRSGGGFACGLGSRLTLKDAARAAILELCQLEIGLQLIAIKTAERGEAALSAVDRRHVARATSIDPATCTLIHPLGSPRAEPTAGIAEDTVPLTAIAAVLSQRAIEAAFVVLTRAEFGIPVVHASAPALQLLPSAIHGPRLRNMISTTGGGSKDHGGVHLI